MISDDLTIAIPVFERIDYFKEALKSAVNQTKSCRILVVDNNSSHNDFARIIEEYNLPNIVFVKNESNLGMLGNWNRCIELCDTKYITILHDDDILHPQFVERTQECDEDWEVLFTTSIVKLNIDSEFFSNIAAVKRTKRININAFAFGNFNYAPGTIFQVKVAKEIGGFSSDYGYILDFHFWILLAIREKAYYLDLPLSFYRLSPEQATNVLYKNMVLNTYKLIELIPAYRNNKFINFLTRFRIYSGGMGLFLKSGGNENDMNEQFADNPYFLRDHILFKKFFKHKFTRKVILNFSHKLMQYNIQRQLL
jgi:glycosyltransferase involved in cell wall biosynthesis